MSAGYDGENRRAPERWRISKEISIGDLVAFASAAVAVVVAYSTLDKRLTVVEDKVSVQRDTDRRQDDDSIRNLARIDSRLTGIDSKLDRLIEARK